MLSAIVYVCEACLSRNASFLLVFRIACTCNDHFHLNALRQQHVYHQSSFLVIFLDWHTSKASLGWSYRYVQQMGQQCQALLWRRRCQAYGRVPGITWHHCAAVSNAGSWTTRQESGKLYNNAPEWSRQGNEPLFKVSWLFPCWIKYLQSTCFLWPIRP